MLLTARVPRSRRTTNGAGVLAGCWTFNDGHVCRPTTSQTCLFPGLNNNRQSRRPSHLLKPAKPAKLTETCSRPACSDIDLAGMAGFHGALRRAAGSEGEVSG